MRVPLAASLEPSHSVTFHMEFSITVPTQGGDFYYGIFGYNHGILSLAHAYPTILVYNEMGWNNQSPDLDGDPLFSDTKFYLVSIDAPASLTGSFRCGGEPPGNSRPAKNIVRRGRTAHDFYLATSTTFVRI